MITIMLLREFSIGSTNNPQIDLFFILITYLVDTVLILLREILSWSLTVKSPSSKNIKMLDNTST